MKDILHVGWQLREENVVAEVLRHMCRCDRPHLWDVKLTVFSVIEYVNHMNTTIHESDCLNCYNLELVPKKNFFQLKKPRKILSTDFIN